MARKFPNQDLVVLKQRRIDELEAKVRELEAQLKGLTEEPDGIDEAIEEWRRLERARHAQS